MNRNKKKLNPFFLFLVFIVFSFDRRLIDRQLDGLSATILILLLSKLLRFAKWEISSRDSVTTYAKPVLG